ncbi:hypothetical protein [Pseudactinotalea sp. Z1748]|uniref:hypothetical protein n=1 Tax=Pseudactinotalea sp. Z1748 TaxID=3413027 RepID=UPI003C7DE736
MHLLQPRVEAEIERQLLETGHAQVPLGEPRFQLDLLTVRAVVRQISQRHGRRYRTYRAPGDALLVAEWTSWPENPREEALDRQVRRQAVEAYSASMRAARARRLQREQDED